MTAATIKTYAQKSSAVRAAKKAHGEDYLNLCTIKGSDADGWIIETEKVVVVEAAQMTTPKLPVAILEAKAAKAEVVLEEKLLEAEAVIGEALEALHENDEAHAALEAGDAQANAALVAESINLDTMNLTHEDSCPHCKINLGNGICDFDHLKEVQGDKAYDLQKREFACMACGFEWGKLVNKVYRPRISTTELPTKKVWHIADEMVATNTANGQPAPKRKEVIEECVRRGVAYGTARTQYQHWFKCTNDAKAAPIATIGKDGSITYPGK